MSAQEKRRKDRRSSLARIVSFALAALMLLSVVLATAWKW